MAARTNPDLPLSYRRDEVGRVLSAITAGESCVLLGIGSVGKSNLLRFLMREDVQHEHLGQAADNTLFVYVDAHKLLEYSPWGLWELMLHQIGIGLSVRAAGCTELEHVEKLHERASLPDTRLLALRYLDRVVALVCGRLGLRLIFLMDDFDRLGSALDATAFAALRALRDDHKYKLAYIVAARRRLLSLCDDPYVIEPFAEIVSNEIWFGPYNRDDADFMVQRLQARYGTDSLSAENAEAILGASGGHPGLLRAAFMVSLERPLDLSGALRDSPRVQDECASIWRSLNPDEQDALVHLVDNPATVLRRTSEFVRLQAKGLIGGPWARPGPLFSSILADYIQRHRPAIGARLEVEEHRREVIVDGCRVEGLSVREYDLIAYLAAHRNEPCSRDSIAEHLYPGEEGVSNSSIDAVIKRARQKMEKISGGQRFIVPVQGYGYKLQDGTSESAE